jgi:hypothetical protein
MLTGTSLPATHVSVNQTELSCRQFPIRALIGACWGLPYVSNFEWPTPRDVSILGACQHTRESEGRFSQRFVNHYTIWS